MKPLDDLKFGIRNLDLFGQGVPLRVGGKPEFKTNIGFGVSVAYVIILLAICVTELLQWLDTTSPKTVGEAYNVYDYPKINLYENKLMPVFISYSNETELIPAEDLDSYFTLRFEMIKWIFFDVTINGKTKRDVRKLVENIPGVPCKYLKSDQMTGFEYIHTDPILSETMMMHGVCPLVPKTAYIVGKDSDILFQVFSFKVLPCSKLNGCKSANEMVLANFQMILPQSNFIVRDTNFPHRFHPSAEEVYYINPNQRQIHSANLKNFLVYDYEGYWPRWNLQASVYDIDSISYTPAYRSAVTSCLKEEAMALDNPSCLPYFEFNIRSGGKVLKNKRTYLTLLEVLSNLGGINVVLVAVLVFFYKGINDSKRKEFLSEQIYQLVRKNPAYDMSKGDQGDDEQQYNLRLDIKEDPRYIKLREDEGRWKCTSKFVKCIRKLRGEEVAERKCFCCKKKTQREINVEKRKILAMKYIDQVLDVANIVRNFNELKVLTHFFFKDRHRDSAQYLGFGLAKQDIEKEIDRKLELLYEERELEKSKEKQDSSDEKPLMGYSKKYIQESVKLENTFKDIKEHLERKPENDLITVQLHHELDIFYWNEYEDLVHEKILPPIADTGVEPLNTNPVETNEDGVMPSPRNPDGDPPQSRPNTGRGRQSLEIESDHEHQ